MKNYLFKKDFWIAAGHRALRTVGQAFVATIAGATMMESVDWRYVCSASLIAGIISIGTSVAFGIPEVEGE